MLGETVANKTGRALLSARTVTRRIEDIAENIEMQLLQNINKSPWYALQVDESTDIENKAVLLVYLRYIFEDEVHENTLCALSMPTNTAGQNIHLIEQLHGWKTVMVTLRWNIRRLGCSYDRKAVRFHRFLVKEVAPDCLSTHCIMRREKCHQNFMEY